MKARWVNEINVFPASPWFIFLRLHHTVIQWGWNGKNVWQILWEYDTWLIAVVQFQYLDMSEIQRDIRNKVFFFLFPPLLPQTWPTPSQLYSCQYNRIFTEGFLKLMVYWEWWGIHWLPVMALTVRKFMLQFVVFSFPPGVTRDVSFVP